MVKVLNAILFACLSRLINDRIIKNKNKSFAFISNIKEFLLNVYGKFSEVIYPKMGHF